MSLTWTRYGLSQATTGEVGSNYIAWGRVNTQPSTATSGVNFELQFHNDYPMLFTGNRPLAFVSSLTLGVP